MNATAAAVALLAALVLWVHVRFASRTSAPAVPRVARPQALGGESVRSPLQAPRGAGEDSAAALLAWFKPLPRELRVQALEAVVGALARTDPLRAVALVDEETTGDVAARLRAQVYAAWARVNPRAAIAALSTREGEATVAQCLAGVIAAWSQDDPAAVSAWLAAAPPGPARDAAWHSLVLALGRTDPDLVAHFLANFREAPLAREAAGSFAATWAQADLPGAIAWLQALPPGAVRNAVVAKIVPAWVRSDPARAADFVLTLPAESRGDACAHVARAWAQTDADGAVRWARSLAPEVRDVFLPALLLGRAEQAPAEAARLFAQLPELGPRARETREQVAIAIVQGWTALNPIAASQWVVGLTDDAVRACALENLIATWMAQDPSQARAWVSMNAPQLTGQL